MVISRLRLDLCTVHYEGHRTSEKKNKSVLVTCSHWFERMFRMSSLAAELYSSKSVHNRTMIR